MIAVPVLSVLGAGAGRADERVPLLGERIARFRPGLGCTLE